jgi:4-guanidinobutyraldehyde dehydrogenase/NAD-dependent aldehyde dehydrogenase
MPSVGIVGSRAADGHQLSLAKGSFVADQHQLDSATAELALRLCDEVHLNLDYSDRWFCRLDLEEAVPDHSTFSKNRHGGPGALALVTREPLGVVGAIVPWNYPLLMAAWKLGPSLAAGNSVVLKPSERSPFSALRLAELALMAGLPPGVLNVVPGYGHEAGEVLVRHADVDGIVFTGSTRIGKQIFAAAGSTNLKRVYTELGGKSALIVCADADVEGAAAAAASCLFHNQGESCNAPTRLVVHESVADLFVEALVEHARRYMPADPLDPAAGMGALVDEAHAAGVMERIEQGRAEGARCVAGGRRATALPGGCYVEPTLFDRASNSMRLAREEIFAPWLPSSAWRVTTMR